MQKIIEKLIFSLLVLSVVCVGLVQARPVEQQGKEDEYLKLLRKSKVFDLQKNTASNIDFYTTNYGIFGFNVQNTLAGTVWPRGSQNSYIFAGGIWFGAQKKVDTAMATLVSVSYNPSSAKSWMRPGRWDDNADKKNDPNRNRLFISTDFNLQTGEPYNKDDGSPNWPIWDSSTNPNDTLRYNRYLGYFIPEPTSRNKETYPKGPAVISGEDIFSTYHDMDLSLYEYGMATSRQKGYPLGLQWEQTIYSWGFGEYKDFIFISYKMNNISKDTLYNCWMAPVMDVDIATVSNSSSGAGNDRVKFYNSDTTLNVAIQWSDVDRGEKGKGFGYLAFDFLESPAVIKHMDTTYEKRVVPKDPFDPSKGDTTITVQVYIERIEKDSKFVRKDKPFYTNDEQLGLRTFRNWAIPYDPDGDAARYAFIAANIREGDTGPGDKRFMMATGPFHMRPHDTTRVVVGIIFGNSSKGIDPDGSDEDMAETIKRDKFAQEVYDANFKAPMPPAQARITGYKSMNHAIQINWDESSEISIDKLEKGMAFLGYKIYRARRDELDTFNLNNISNVTDSKTKGPFGWKQMASYEIRTPFNKSYRRAGGNQKNLNMPLIDSLMVVGPYIDKATGLIDSNKIAVMRIPRGVVIRSPRECLDSMKTIGVSVLKVDTGAYQAPWGNFYKMMLDGSPNRTPFYAHNSKTNCILFDSLMLGYVELDRAIMRYNPLFYRMKTMTNNSINAQLTKDSLFINPKNNNLIDSVYLAGSLRLEKFNGQPSYVVDVLVPHANVSAVFANTIYYSEVSDALYSLIEKRLAKKVVFPTFDGNEKNEFEQSFYAKEYIIKPYFAKITNNRTFVDIGDDNENGIIDLDDDPTKTEQLVNNVPYYYKIISWDEGDYMQPSNSKSNVAGAGSLNFAETYAMAARVGNTCDFQVVYADSAKLGGLYNFKFFGIDQERVRQVFAGKTLELEFNPYWKSSKLNFKPSDSKNPEKEFGLYSNTMILRDSATGQILFNGRTFFEEQPCDLGYRGLFTEKGFTYVFSDTAIYDSVTKRMITFGLPENKDIVTRSGKFSTGSFETPGQCYTPALLNPAYGTLGFSFDYTMQQYGGYYRLDTVYADPNVKAGTRIFYKKDPTNKDIVMATQTVSSNEMINDRAYFYAINKDASFNNGPGNYEIEFTEGGKEDMTLSWYDAESNEVKNNTFNVSYLNMKVNNTTSFNRFSPDTPGKDSIKVFYPGMMPHMELPTTPAYSYYAEDYNSTNAVTSVPARYYPDPRGLAVAPNGNTNDFIGKFNLYATGVVNGRNVSALKIANYFATQNLDKSNVGTQGRYYISAQSTKPNASGSYDQVDFCHNLNIAGCRILLDYSNKGMSKEAKKDATKGGIFVGSTQNYTAATNYVYGDDFKAGDKLYFNTFGGAFGLPLPGAKVRVKISNGNVASSDITDDLMDQIKVVPNPYFISHQGQKSPYDAKIYFTKLPAICSIDIYTINGELVKTLNHNEDNDGEAKKASLDIWNLLTKNGQRIASQAFIAVIKTPDGAQTIKNFSVVVGGFNVTTE